MLQLLHEVYSFKHLPLSVARYSYIQLSELWGERNCQSYEMAGKGFKLGFSRLRVQHSNHYATASHIIFSAVFIRLRLIAKSCIPLFSLFSAVTTTANTFRQEIQGKNVREERFFSNNFNISIFFINNLLSGVKAVVEGDVGRVGLVWSDDKRVKRLLSFHQRQQL